jgi:hypothetical protein
MATNQAIDGRQHINVAVPTAVTVGMPILIGTLAGVVLALQPIPAGAGSYTTATVDLGEDCYNLTVVGQSQLSPNSIQQIKPGDELFASGTYDATTNVTYSLTIDKTRGNVPFGNSLDAVAAGATNTTCRVRLKDGGSGAYAS